MAMCVLCNAGMNVRSGMSVPPGEDEKVQASEAQAGDAEANGNHANSIETSQHAAKKGKAKKGKDGGQKDFALLRNFCIIAEAFNASLTF
jgi:hypothetical protein